MSRKIIGVTVGTPISSTRLDREIKPVKTVNGVAPDESGNVKVKTDGTNALKGNASGEVVCLDDVSPLEHEMGVNVRSKNLSKNIKKTGKAQNLTAALENNLITINGSSSIDVALGESYSENDCFLLQPDKYTFLLKYVGGSPDSTEAFYFGLRSFNTGSWVTSYGVKNSNYMEDAKTTFTIKEPTLCYVACVGKGSYDNLQYQVQIEKGTTATPYTPFVDVSGVKLLVQGENLISSDLWSDLFDKQADGSYLSNQQITKSVSTRYVYLPAAIYTISYYLKCSAGANVRFGIRYSDETEADKYIHSTGEYVYCSFTTNGKPIKAIFFNYSKYADDIQFKELQIKVGTETEYKPYKAPVEYSVNADGTVEGVKSIAPSTTLMTDTEGVRIECEYNKDANKVVATLEERLAALETAIISQ